MAFTGTHSPLGGIGFAELEAEALARVAAAAEAAPKLENPGYVKFRKGGEPHATTPEVVSALQEVRAAHHLRRAVDGGGWELYERFSSLVNDRAPLEPRDLLELVPAGPPIPLDEVEPVHEIVRRFSGGAMSLGALSAEAHELIGIALSPHRREGEHGRGRRGAVPLPLGVELRDQADRVGPLRRHARVRGVRAGAPDQDRPGLEAGRGRSAAGAQGDSRDRPHAPHAARGRAHLAAAAPRHLLDRGPRAAHLRSAPGQPGRGRLREARRRGRGRDRRRRRRQGARGRRPRRRRRWRHRRQPADVDQERGRALGARAGRDAAGAGRERAARPRAGACRRRLQDGPRRRRRDAARRRRGQLRDGAPDRRGLPAGADVPHGHLPGRHRDPAARAAREVRGDAEMVETYLLLVAEEARRLLASLGLRSLDEAVGRVELLRQRTPATRARTRSTSRRCSAARARARRATPASTAPRAAGWELGARLADDAAPALADASLVELALPDRERRPHRRGAAGRADRPRVRAEPAARARPRPLRGRRRAELRGVPRRRGRAGADRRGERLRRQGHERRPHRRAPAGRRRGRALPPRQYRPLRRHRRRALLRRERRRALRRPQLGRRRGGRGRRRPSLRVHDERHGGRSSAATASTSGPA